MRWAVLVVVLAAGTAHAGDDGRLRPSLVKATLDGAQAHLTARFLIAKQAAGDDSVVIELPDGALVTGATVADHRLALVEAEAAETAFQAVHQAPITRDARWAAKVVRSGTDSVIVSLLSPEAGLASLELEIAAPTCYFRDARYVAIPATWAHALPLALRVATPPECGTSETWLALPDRALIGRAGGFDRIGGDAGRLALGDQHVARLELDIASRLGEVPRDLATVILLDSSRSLTESQVREQRKLVLAYVRRVPDTRVQILAFARTAHPVLPGWTTGSQALPQLERRLAAEPLRNGSNLDDALADAQAWLARLPGTHRILIVTDELLPERILVPQLRGGLAPDTLVHVANVAASSGPLVREDDGVLGTLAAATYGIRVRGAGDDPEILVRPISIDQLRVRAPGWADMNRSDARCGLADVQLGEGTACTWWLTADPSAGPITVEGLVWGRRLARTFAPDLGRALPLARELSGRGGLDEAHQALADRAARAVNPVWSLFGAWGGRGGYGDGLGGFGLSGIGATCGCDGFGTIGHGSAGPNPGDDHLAAQLAPAVTACHAERDRVSVKLELTLAETVDVGVEIQHSPDEDLAGAVRHRRDCLIEAIWEIELAIGVPRDHQTVTVDLGK